MQKLTRHEWFFGTCGLLIGIFFACFDLQLLGVISASIAYVSLLGLGILAKSRRLVLLLGVLGILLTYMGYLLVPEVAGVRTDLTNRHLVTIAIMTITVTTFIYMTRQVEFEQRILKLSNTDELTGVYNRRALMAELEKRINESQRHGGKLSLILFDIDNFKEINDRFGHMAGDDILKRLTSICQKWLRLTDSMGRYGGEEFLVLCPNTSLDGARVLADRIRQAIEQTDFLYRKNLLRVTISCGVTELSNHLQAGRTRQNEIELAHDMVDAADSAMYHAKKCGKNFVYAYEPDGKDLLHNIAS